MDNKNIFASNLKRYMKLHNKTRKEVSEALGVSYFTFSDWVNGKKYPRMDKVEMLADYFGILKSDLIEDKSILEMIEEKPVETANKMVDSLLRLGIELKEDDSEFMTMIDEYKQLDENKQEQVREYVHFLLERS